jgi:hypothetical protein
MEAKQTNKYKQFSDVPLRCPICDKELKYPIFKQDIIRHTKTKKCMRV